MKRTEYIFAFRAFHVWQLRKKGMKLSQIAQLLGVGKERVRQIFLKVERILMSPPEWDDGLSHLSKRVLSDMGLRTLDDTRRAFAGGKIKPGHYRLCGIKVCEEIKKFLNTPPKTQDYYPIFMEYMQHDDTPITSTPPRVVAAPITPEFIRLPAPGDLCAFSGLTRSALNELILPTPRNDHKPPVKSYCLRKKGARTGIRIIDYASLRDYIRAHAQESTED